MNKIKLTRDVKIGVMTVVAIFILYFGLNFLKGVKIFSPITYYYAVYENVGGLVPSSPVFVKGYKVGQVEEIKYDFTRQNSFVVKISVSEDIILPKGASIQLFDDGLMGGKAIQLVYGPYNTSDAMYAPGDTLPAVVAGGLMAQLSGELMPKIESISTQADSLLRAVRFVVEGKALNNSLASIEKTTADLAVTSAQLKSVMKNDVPKLMTDVHAITGDFKVISGNLRKIDYVSTFNQIDLTIRDLKTITKKVNDGEGSLGLLLNDKSLYVNMANTMSDADNLLIDLKNRPKRYVHFSLFGSKAE